MEARARPTPPSSIIALHACLGGTVRLVSVVVLGSRGAEITTMIQAVSSVSRLMSSETFALRQLHIYSDREKVIQR